MKGETLAIVGESGSGKSVTIKAILGILAKNGHIDSGSILYQGEDMAKYKEKDFIRSEEKRISLVFQDPLSALNPIMKIGKQISEALILSGSIEKSKAKQRAIELMEAVGIRTRQSGMSISVPVLRRYEAAHCHCNCPCMQSGDPDLR